MAKKAVKNDSIEIDLIYTLQKCKHRWNNGIQVRVLEGNRGGGYVTVDTDGNRYIVDCENLKR